MVVQGNRIHGTLYLVQLHMIAEPVQSAQSKVVEGQLAQPVSVPISSATFQVMFNLASRTKLKLKA